MTTKLSPAMEAAMRKLSGEWQMASAMRIRFDTLRALRKCGFVEIYDNRYPGTGWRLTERGEQWLKS